MKLIKEFKAEDKRGRTATLRFLKDEGQLVVRVYEGKSRTSEIRFDKEVTPDLIKGIIQTYSSLVGREENIGKALGELSDETKGELVNQLLMDIADLDGVKTIRQYRKLWNTARLNLPSFQNVK